MHQSTVIKCNFEVLSFSAPLYFNSSISEGNTESFHYNCISLAEEPPPGFLLTQLTDKTPNIHLFFYFESLFWNYGFVSLTSTYYITEPYT